MIKPGMIGFSNNKKGLLPALIRFFTKSKVSHTFITTSDLCGEATVQEAAQLVQIVPFSKYYEADSTQSYWIFKIKDGFVSEEKKLESLKKCFLEFSGVKYGYLQLIWFVYRWLNEKIGRDVRKNKNWMADGVICSELTYHYLNNLGDPFTNLLKDFNPDTIQPEDLKIVIEKNPDLFEFYLHKF